MEVPLLLCGAGLFLCTRSGKRRCRAAADAEGVVPMTTVKPIEVTFELVTPAYAGSAYREKTDGLRPPTLKALLRFWWRALHPEMATENLFKREALLFGATDEDIGQGVRLIPCGTWPQWQYDPPRQKVNQNWEDWHIYTAYGAVAWSKSARAQVTQVPRLNADQSVKFNLALPHRLGLQRAQEARRELMKTLWLLSAFGGIGSRSRRLWGSLRVETEWPADLPDIHGNMGDPVDRLARGLQTVFGDNPLANVPSTGLKFTGFSSDARLFVGSRQCTSWRDAAEKVAGTYHTYRKRLGKNYGSSNRPGPDYGRFLKLLKMKKQPKKKHIPEGVAFGAPNDRRSRTTGDLLQVGVGPDLTGRRASPLFLKVIGRHGAYRPLILWLPSQYLPDGVDIYVARGGRAVRVPYPGDTGIRKFFEGRADVDPDWVGIAEHEDWEEVRF